jgi:hypothetical protein
MESFKVSEIRMRPIASNFDLNSSNLDIFNEINVCKDHINFSKFKEENGLIHATLYSIPFDIKNLKNHEIKYYENECPKIRSHI